ncbi:hypothetical protein LCGC14_2232160, partial [marine sediment metagenome]
MKGVPESKWKLTEYDAVRRAAQSEHPPGRKTLYLGALDTLRTGDRTFVERASTAVRGNIPDADLLQIYGTALFDSGHIDDGLAALQKARTANPNRENLLIFGSRLEGAGKLAAAAEAFRELLARNRADTEAGLRLGFVLGQVPRWREAEQRFQDVLRRDAGCGAAHLGIADAHLQRRQYAQARRHVRKAIREGCEAMPRAWHILSISEAHGLRFRKACKAAQEYARRAAGHDSASELLREFEGQEDFGLAYFEANRDKDALPWLKYEAIRKPPSMMARLYLASLEAKMRGDAGIIKAAAEDVAGVLPEDVVWRVSGMTKCQIGSEAEGIHELRQALRLNPSAHNKLCLASRLARGGQTAEGRSLCQEILVEIPDSPTTLGHLALMTEDPEEWLRLYRAARDADPEDGMCQYHVGYALETLGHPDEACHEYEMALKLDLYEP